MTLKQLRTWKKEMAEMCQCGHLREMHSRDGNSGYCHGDDKQCPCEGFVLEGTQKDQLNPNPESKKPAERVNELCTCGHTKGEHKDAALECYGNGDTCNCESFTLATASVAKP